MRTRPAEPTDIPDILELWVELIAYHRPFDDVFELGEGGVESFRKHLTEQVASEEAFVAVAEADGAVVGFITANVGRYPPVFVRKHCGIIENMGVRESHRRAGYGELLLDDALNWLRTQGQNRVELRVASRNDTGNAFWRKHGFTDYIRILYRDIP